MRADLPSQKQVDNVEPDQRGSPRDRHWCRGSAFAVWMSLLWLLALVVVGCGSGEREDSPGVATTVLVTEPVEIAASPEPTQVVAATSQPETGPSATPPAPLIARVNGQPIYLADFERRLSQYMDALIEQGLEPGTEEGQAQVAHVESDVLESLIDFALIEQGGSLMGVVVGAEEVDAQLEADISAGGGLDAFEEWLALSGLTRDDYRQVVRESMVSQGVLDDISAELPEQVEQVHARHIVVATLPEAEELLSLIQDGGDFAELAGEHSQDVSTREDGGDLGWFPRGLLAPELEEAAFALQKEEVSGVIPLGEGFHIIQVIDRKLIRELTPEVRMNLVLALFDGWLEEQRSGADIERFVTD